MNKRVFIKNTAIMTVTSLLLRTLGIVFRIFISNRVGAEGMGLYQLVFSVYILGGTFASAGLTTAVTRMAAEQLSRQNLPALHRVMRLSFAACLLVGGASAALLYFGAPLISGWIGDIRTLRAISISGIALPFIGISSCLKGYFMARRKSEAPCLSQLVEQMIRIGSILWLLHTRWDGSLEQACVIIIASDALSETAACIQLYITYRFDRRRLFFPQKAEQPRPPIWRPMLHIALPLTAGRYLSTILRTIENILVPARLTLFTHSAALSLEQFGAVKGMALPLLFFPSAFLITISNLLMPELSDAHALGQRRQVARLVEYTLQITLLASILLGGLFTTLGETLGDRLYAHSTVGVLLQILGPLAPVMYLDSVATGMLKGLGEQVHSLWFSVLDSAVRIVLIWLLLPRFGLMGFLFVMLVSNILTCVLSTRHLLYVSKSRLAVWRSLLGPVTAALIAGVSWRIGVPASDTYLWIIGGCVWITVIYLLLLQVFGCFSQIDRQRLTIKRSA